MQMAQRGGYSNKITQAVHGSAEHRAQFCHFQWQTLLTPRINVLGPISSRQAGLFTMQCLRPHNDPDYTKRNNTFLMEEIPGIMTKKSYIKISRDDVAFRSHQVGKSLLNASLHSVCIEIFVKMDSKDMLCFTGEVKIGKNRFFF